MRFLIIVITIVVFNGCWDYSLIPVEPPPNMVYIPGGTFTMGENDLDGLTLDASDGTKHHTPERPEYTSAFYIDKYEVTVGQFSECDRFVNRSSPLGRNGKQNHAEKTDCTFYRVKLLISKSIV